MERRPNFRSTLLVWLKRIVLLPGAIPSDVSFLGFNFGKNVFGKVGDKERVDTVSLFRAVLPHMWCCLRLKYVELPFERNLQKKSREKFNMPSRSAEIFSFKIFGVMYYI